MTENASCSRIAVPENETIFSPTSNSRTRVRSRDLSLHSCSFPRSCACPIFSDFVDSRCASSDHDRSRNARLDVEDGQTHGLQANCAFVIPVARYLHALPVEPVERSERISKIPGYLALIVERRGFDLRNDDVSYRRSRWKQMSKRFSFDENEKWINGERSRSSLARSAHTDNTDVHDIALYFIHADRSMAA